MDYSDDINNDGADTSLAKSFENLANTLRKPSQWINATWLKTNNYKIYPQFQSINAGGAFLGFVGEPRAVTFDPNWIKTALRIIAGVILAIPGQVFGALAMGVAYSLSKEIRLKHSASAYTLSTDEKKTLKSLIKQRQGLAKTQEKCEPISCILCSILCALLVIVCKKPA